MKLPLDITKIKGFMPEDEGEALFEAAVTRAPFGPCLEIGSYCGKSAVYIGTACKAVGSVLFTVDHHRGSEENQPGWEWHDKETWDSEAGAMDTLPFLRRTLREAELEDIVIPIIGPSATIAQYWQMPLSLLFIDGGHASEHAMNDLHGWSPHVMPGGWLAIHDVFPNPADGGCPPYEIYQLALASGEFADVRTVGSLKILQRR